MKNEESRVYYQPICMSIGIGLGMAIGAAFDQLTVGMCVGIGLGLAVGGVIDYIKNKKRSVQKALRVQGFLCAVKAGRFGRLHAHRR